MLIREMMDKNVKRVGAAQFRAAGLQPRQSTLYRAHLLRRHARLPVRICHHGTEGRVDALESVGMCGGRQVRSHMDWASVVAKGRYEEFPDTPEYSKQRQRAQALLEKTRSLRWKLDLPLRRPANGSIETSPSFMAFTSMNSRVVVLRRIQLNNLDSPTFP